MKYFFALAAVMAAMTLNAGNLYPMRTGAVRLGWKHSPSSNVAGYYLLVGPASRTYTNSITLPYTNQTAVSNLAPGGHYYFTIVAFSSFGDESPQSNEVDWQVPLVLPPGALRY